MKKLIATVLILAMMLSLLAACGKNETITENNGQNEGKRETESAEPAGTEAEEIVIRDWEADKDNHWYLDDQGAQMGLEAHKLDGEGCTVCGAEIEDFGDGEIWVTIYNEQDDAILSVSYLDGEMVENKKRAYTYDEEGRWSTVAKYSFGVLTEETVFQVINGEDSWECIPEQTTTYNEDGTKLVEKFDETSWTVAETLYDADGKVVYDYTITNEFNDQSFISSIKKFEGETLAAEITYEYDENENSVADRYYEYGKLVREEFYTSVAEEDFTYSYVSKVIEYQEDGTQTVTEYDENGDVIG